MIYFVDEDKIDIDPYAMYLSSLGHKVKLLHDADEAYNTLIEANDIELIILDVMLATAEGENSRYSPQDTHFFTITGLTLLDDLVSYYKNGANRKASNIIPNKVILFSAATSSKIVNLINNKVQAYNIEFLPKDDYDEVDLFYQKIRGML